MSYRSMLSLIAVIAVGCAGGCSKPGRDLQMAPVVGSVTLGGTPLKDGLVSLENSTTGYAAAAALDSNGEFLVRKIPTGTYSVAVCPPEPPAPGETAPPRPASLGPLRIAPSKFHSMLTSGLNVTVTGGQDEKLKIELP